MHIRIIFFLLFVSSFLHAMPGYYEPWGKDAGLKRPTEQAEKESSILVKAAEKVILFHQNILSPVDGPRSHFRPTSSRYMLLAMRKHGFFKGYIMGCDRLLRENDDPWLYRTIAIDDKLYKFDPVR